MKSHLLLALWLILSSALHCDGNICPQQKQSHDFADCGMVPAQVATLMPNTNLDEKETSNYFHLFNHGGVKSCWKPARINSARQIPL